jgi:hypothetical protein
MIARWEQGRAEMDRLLADGHLERVSPDRDLADHIMAQADAHLSAAIAVLDTDPIVQSAIRPADARRSRRVQLDASGAQSLGVPHVRSRLLLDQMPVYGR